MWTVFENASPTLSVRHAGNFRGRQMNDPPLVRIERPELLIEP